MSNRELNQGASNDDSTDAAFLARVAASLKEAERLDPSFEQRLATALRRDRDPHEATAPSSDSPLGWLTRKRTVRISPLVGLALAAGIAAAAALGALSVAGTRGERLTTTASSVPARAGVVHVVRFVFIDSTARSVALVGDFNGWSRTAADLEPTGAPGAWSISVPLSPGRHEYAFIVDGTRWVADPFAAIVHDDFGTESSVIQLGRDSAVGTTGA